MGEFKGFEPEAMKFLGALASRDPAWFKANKKDYQRLIAEPAKALVRDLGELLKAGTSRALVAEAKTNGSIAPINNDLRFSPDKPPYKDHLLLKFWEGASKKTAATLYLRISRKNIGFATGAIFSDLDRWRKTVAGDSGAELVSAISKLTARRRGEIVGQELKRVPSPYAPDHPRADLLRHKMLQIRWTEASPAAVHQPAFASWCATRLERCAGVHHWLVRELETGRKRA